MNQLTIDEDAICVGAKPCKENGTLAFNDNAVLRGLTYSECVAVQGRERELRERRKWALFRYNLSIRQNAQPAGDRISVDLNPRVRA